MATTYKIHPAIGIARLGNSPDDFFIGPERLRERPEPAGGFKDAECRVKRQAARFRIFAHHDDGSVTEITDAEADISWTVHLANRKAPYPGRGNSESPGDLTIDPGAQTLSGPNQRRLFDGGAIRFAGQPVTTVPLGEIRSDSTNRLLVLGGFGHSASPAGNAISNFWGNPGWYDDISDGSVSATIQLRSDGSTPPVLGAWVLVAPPKFAPHQDSVTTLYDRMLQAMVDAGLATAPTTTSYTHDIYPILQRARDIKWVYATSAHSWADPVVDPAQRQAIFNRLKPPGNMPLLESLDPAGDDSVLTPIQRAHMQRWLDGTFTNDWAGVPGPEAGVTPSGLDRAALEAGVGAAFFPGIEAGGRDASNRPILAAANYSEAFRVNHGVAAPGTMSASMALPWQADFLACSDNWWPVPRPNSVLPQSGGGYQSWDRGLGSYEDMVAKWHTLGFVVRQGAEHVEVDRCATPTITLLTPYLHFADVPQGPLGMVREQPLAITFEVISPSTSVTLRYTATGGLAHAQLVAANTTVTVGPTAGNSVASARLWVIYRTGAAPSAIPTQTVTVEDTLSGQTWDVTIDANTVARKTAAVALVLDRSGSMSEDRGDGQTKHASLQQAAEIFVDVMLEGDGVGLVRYNQDADVVQTVRALGAGGISDTNRNATIDAIRGNAFDPGGSTSIGDGIHEGHQLLQSATGFDVEALAVLTDGVENSPRFISDVAAELDERTYAIGLGTPQNTSAAALQNVSGNSGGYLLVTGSIGTDDRFLLQKYFLQILAGVSNAEVVLDPAGELVRGAVHRIPFQLTDADAGVDVILLSPFVKAIDFRLQTPTGQIIEPWRALQERSMRYVLGNGVSYFRLVLPTQLMPTRFEQGGTWHALLTLGTPRTEPTPADPEGVDRRIARGLHSTAASRARAARLVTTQTESQRRFALADAASAAPVLAEALVAAGLGEASSRRAVPYSLVVHAYSSVSLRAELRQKSYEPGARVRIRATLSQSGLPLEGQAAVWGELVRPDRSRVDLEFSPAGGGEFGAQFVASSVGVHVVRVRARGVTRVGQPFSRELTLNAAVWGGGDRDATNAAGGGSDRIIEALHERDRNLCKLLRCLVRRDGVIEPELERAWKAKGLDLSELRKCLDSFCKTHPPRPGSEG